MGVPYMIPAPTYGLAPPQDQHKFLTLAYYANAITIIVSFRCGINRFLQLLFTNSFSVCWELVCYFGVLDL